MPRKMKLSINRNSIWCDLFVKQLSDLGVKYACISPGSRSTPLTLAFAQNKSIKSFPIVDERSSAFFALGMAKKTKEPVAVVTTSGTAVAELYPAIIEAFYQRIPLIICTADRPHYLRDSGSNQTINQNNIYSNHIRFFTDAGLPEVNFKKLTHIKKSAEKIFYHSTIIDRGPVHINFPFEKPFEPDNYTDKIELSLIEKLFKPTDKKIFETKVSIKNIKGVVDKLKLCKRGLILVGYNNYEKKFAGLVAKLSTALGFPIFADGSSGLRYGLHSKSNVIDNFSTLVRDKLFLEKYDPELIIQFGGAPVSNVVLEFFKNSKAEKILINEYGDKNDPSLTAKKIIDCEPSSFCSDALTIISESNFKKNKEWLSDLLHLNNEAEKIKRRVMRKSQVDFEGKIIFELLETIPTKSNMMISNSLPIRDIDFFSSSNQKEINVYCNRGASGIDGIISTALGIAQTSKNPTILLTGDLAFYHDMNGLHNAIKFNIPLTIVLINNNGGGIFESLPISRFGKTFVENFITPLNLNFAKFVQAYGGYFVRAKNLKSFKTELNKAVSSKKLAVIEIKSNSKKSKTQREEIWKSSVEKINSYINENRS